MSTRFTSGIRYFSKTIELACGRNPGGIRMELPSYPKESFVLSDEIEGYPNGIHIMPTHFTFNITFFVLASIDVRKCMRKEAFIDKRRVDVRTSGTFAKTSRRA